MKLNPGDTAIIKADTVITAMWKENEKPVLWAYQEEITTGTDPDRFTPNGTCTRGQAVTFLFRISYED